VSGAVESAFAKPKGRVAVALGTMNFGRRTPEAEARKIVDLAYERGVRVIDTANVYESGASERIVGRAIKARRSDWILATKVGLDRTGGKPEGLSPDAIRAACEASLRRLGTDAIDVYYLHAPDYGVPIEQTLQAMHELRALGKIHALGASNYASWQLLEMLEWSKANGAPAPVVSQLLYNMLVRQLDVEYFRFARRYGIHTTTYNALAGGLLARRDLALDAIPPGSRFDKNPMYQRRYWSRALFEAIEQYRALATDAGMTLAALAYSWLAASEDVDSVLVGPASVDQLAIALDALAKPLDSALLRRVDEVALALAGTDARYAR
jgi:aryl-alcohol dehydrogenase-like predicted oxidoreductase